MSLPVPASYMAEVFPVEEAKEEIPPLLLDAGLGPTGSPGPAAVDRRRSGCPRSLYRGVICKWLLIYYYNCMSLTVAMQRFAR